MNMKGNRLYDKDLAKRALHAVTGADSDAEPDKKATAKEEQKKKEKAQKKAKDDDDSEDCPVVVFAKAC